jgi:hypothetical protein
VVPYAEEPGKELSCLFWVGIEWRLQRDLVEVLKDQTPLYIRAPWAQELGLRRQEELGAHLELPPVFYLSFCFLNPHSWS